MLHLYTSILKATDLGIIRNLSERGKSSQHPLTILKYTFVIFIWKETIALQTAMMVLTSCLTDAKGVF